MPRVLPIFSLLFLLLPISAGAQPRHLYLTWEDSDTARTQTIVFQTLNKATQPRVEIEIEGKSKVFPAKTARVLERRIHKVTIKGLRPATKYRFRAGDDRYGLSRWRSFRTLPADGRKLTMITGGDMYRHPATVQLLAAGAKFRPDVALIGGDIAYTNGELRNRAFWDDWFDNWERNLNPKDGPMVPMICAIGNHEVQGHFSLDRRKAPMFFAYMPQGPNPYFTRRLGRDIELVVLDSGHVTAHQSQVGFLEKALQQAQDRKVPFKIALYHVPLYPSHRNPDEYYHAIGRKVWAPLFDKYQVTAALENHEHVFKRTFPLKGNKVTSKGTVYLGDGCWGRPPRKVHKRWYHEKALPKAHIWVLSNQKDVLDCRAIDQLGKTFDSTQLRGASVVGE